MEFGEDGRPLPQRRPLGAKTRFSAVALLVSAALVGIACDSGAPEQAPVAAAPTGITGVSWKASARYTYKTKLSSHLSVKGGEMMDLSLETTLALDARATKEGTVELAARLEKTSFKAVEPELRSKFDALAKELEQPFALTLADGRLSEVRLPHDFSAFAASIARTLAASLQMAEAEGDAAGQTWSVSERDGTGTYDAEYKRVARDEVAKRKLSYRETAAAGSIGLNLNAKLAPKVISSAGKLLFEAPREGDGARRARLRRLEYDEKLEARLAPTAPLTSSTKLELTLVSAERPPTAYDWNALVASTRAIAPDALYGTAPHKSAYDSVRIGDYTIDRALRELEEQAKDPKSNQLSRSVRDAPPSPDAQAKQETTLLEQSRVFNATAALIRSDPKHIPLVVAKVRANSPALRALLDALSTAGTPEAQKALVELMEDRKLSDGVRRAAAFSLARTEEATTATVLALTQHLGSTDPLRIHALYGLGTIARRLRDAKQSERAEAISATLVEQLRRGTTPDEQVHALRAIANSGHSAAFDAVQPLLTSDAVKVRAASIDALRLMDRPEVDGIIATRLTQDVAGVQVAALDAIAVRTPNDTLTEALKTTARSAADSSIRIRAIRQMGQWQRQRPELKTTLRELESTDQPEAIRRAAGTALGT
jgi:hypothetical protein